MAAWRRGVFDEDLPPGFAVIFPRAVKWQRLFAGYVRVSDFTQPCVKLSGFGPVLGVKILPTR
jgi:hypothetical protein